jgi:dCTP deaminase
VILSHQEIQDALDRELIRIDPVPDKKHWTSTALDLTLDRVLLRWTPKLPPTGEAQRLRPKSSNFNVQGMMEEPSCATKIEIDGEHGYSLEPHDFVLGFTKEIVQLPIYSRIAARVEGKSSLARIGVGVHLTAPTIHAGFGYDRGDPENRGRPIQLEIFNLGNWTVVLDEGMPICQLIFEEVREAPTTAYAGQFHSQTQFRVENHRMVKKKRKKRK